MPIVEGTGEFGAEWTLPEVPECGHFIWLCTKQHFKRTDNTRIIKKQVASSEHERNSESRAHASMNEQVE